jgi:hypothetical protein
MHLHEKFLIPRWISMCAIKLLRDVDTKLQSAHSNLGNLPSCFRSQYINDVCVENTWILIKKKSYDFNSFSQDHVLYSLLFHKYGKHSVFSFLVNIFVVNAIDSLYCFDNVSNKLRNLFDHL